MNRMFIMAACVFLVGPVAATEDAVTVRIRNFLVPPSTGPAVAIEIGNPTAQRFEGMVNVDFPAGWKIAPRQQPVQLKPGEVKKLSVTIERGEDRATNFYPVSVTVEGATGPVVRHQQVCCASTPFYQPKVDGNLKEWDDAIPITFSVAGKKTVVRTYWNRRQFCLAVEVEESHLIGLKDSSSQTGMDAVQFALAPAGSATGGEDGNSSVRHEFLVADSGSAFGRDKCFRLAQPGDTLDPGRPGGPLQPLFFQEAEVAVKRKGKVTAYEVAIPFPHLPPLRPAPGREYNFSLLVHDPDGTGLRDLGAVMNLTDHDRHPRAWSSWENVRWKNQVPFDNKIEFGFCSSIH